MEGKHRTVRVAGRRPIQARPGVTGREGHRTREGLCASHSPTSRAVQICPSLSHGRVPRYPSTAHKGTAGFNAPAERSLAGFLMGDCMSNEPQIRSAPSPIRAPGARHSPLLPSASFADSYTDIFSGRYRSRRQEIRRGYRVSDAREGKPLYLSDKTPVMGSTACLLNFAARNIDREIRPGPRGRKIEGSLAGPWNLHSREGTHLPTPCRGHRTISGRMVDNQPPYSRIIRSYSRLRKRSRLHNVHSNHPGGTRR